MAVGLVDSIYDVIIYALASDESDLPQHLKSSEITGGPAVFFAPVQWHELLQIEVSDAMVAC